mmetsp:Transcript_757/g.1819  ORF Transcript_757/g.1819 Transcript_757/m.1819 type:complete len:119 (-) Transcript_757:456-812(-)|eukprot:CAMPEP_0172458550 /NCGR_PEP_ID=MMETSP1065-20121228/28135_1 /TAXON_ID=265537 /ORGANISM="Amphiprora paludosa, Strain CCMP125" /LENGTH=118 /DNA_ID=CAMNT_0013212869 /DNA_START=152 /DNA_END=508 /DNA_ORIENTATION=-
MRSFLLILFALVVGVAARRGAGPTQINPPGTNTLEDVDGMRWAYPYGPYGWGFENLPDQPNKTTSNVEEKAMKEVKRAPKTPVQNKKSKEENHPGWFGVSSDKHPMWQHVEEVMDGLE